MPPVPMWRGGLRVSNATSAWRWRRTVWITSRVLVAFVHLRPQRAAHAEQADESFGFLHAPVGRLRVRRALGVEQVRRTHGHRIDAAAAGFQHHFAVDHALAGDEESFEI